MNYREEAGYLTLLEQVIKRGERRSNRTGTDTLSIFGPQLEFRLDLGTFPLVTTKKIWWKGIAVELDWMLQGSTNVAYLQEHGVKIWDEWAQASYKPEMGYAEGELGPVYGAQWRYCPAQDRDGASYREEFAELFESCMENERKGLATLRPVGEVDEEILPEHLSHMKFVGRGASLIRWTFEGLRKHALDAGVSAEEVDAAVDYDDRSPTGAAASAWRLVCLKREAQASPTTMKWNAARGWYFDQIAAIVHKLRHQRDDRRILLSSWNVAQIERMKLPPCHYAAQFLVDGELGLTCILSIRSWDLFLGAPFNIGQYALLTHLLAKVSGLVPRRLVINVGDAHIYVNHVEQVKIQIERQLRVGPRLVLPDSLTEIDDFRWDMAKIENYDPHPHLAGDVAV